MKIYFSCSLTGGRGDQPIYAALVARLQNLGHDVLTAHLAHSEALAVEGNQDDVTVYDRDTAWVRECDVMVAEVSTPSHGVGFEVAYALAYGKPVFCCARTGVPVSKMVTGCPDLTMARYASDLEALEAMEAFLDTLLN